ncbi:MalY/PatB family protein [Salinicoccus sp. Marseille-QA3877]
MIYNFDEPVDRRGTYSVKWDGGELIKEMGLTERYDEETIPLFTADMDLPAPQPVIDALYATVDHRIFGYSIFPEEYDNAIQNWFLRKHDWKILKEEIVYCPGTVLAVNKAVTAFTEAGDGIIIQRPSYPPFAGAVEGNERTLLNNPLKQDDDGKYQIDFDDFEEKAKLDTTKMFILCNPHNPTGRVFSDEDLLRLSDICKDNDVLLIADEIHGDIIRRDQSFSPVAALVDDTEHIITLTAINKTFNVAGLHCSNIIITDPDKRETFKNELGMQMPSPFTIAALIAAYNEGDEWLEQLNDYLDETIEFTTSFLKENMPKVDFHIPEGTYVMWLDFSGYNISPEAVHDRIYNKANVLLEDGDMFGEEGADFQRICLPSPRPMIKEALERISSEFEDLK